MALDYNFDCFQLVPDSVMIKIFAHVSTQRFLNLFTLKLVCKRWYSLAMDSTLWRKICFSRCENLNFPVLEQTLAYSSSVQEVEIDWCSLVDDYCLELIAERCPHLSALNVKGCRKVSDNGVIKIAENCINLKRISLSFYNNNLTSMALVKIIENCP